MLLTEEDKRMLGGEYGPGVEKAMNFLVNYGEAFDAARLVDVHSAHILPDPLDMLNELMEGVDHVRTMATIHSGSPLGSRWVKDLGLSEEDAGPVVAESKKAIDIYAEKGVYPVNTCAPYVMGNVLKKNHVFSWAGSSGIVINNSLFGARGNRDSGLAMTSCAITGRTPEIGKIRDEERFGQVLFRFQKVDVEKLTQADLGSIGYSIGKIAQTKNVVIDGLPSNIPFEKLKYLLSPLPVSGAVSMCHIIGVTPEAPDINTAFGNRRPETEISVTPKDMAESSAALNDYENNDVDVVMLGCPHLTINELRDISYYLNGKRISDKTRLFLATNEGVYNIGKRMGYIDTISRSGGLVITDSCIAVFPFAKMKTDVERVATNSVRCAHYTLRGGAGEVMGGKIMKTFYGYTKKCLDAAINGKWED